MTFLDAYFVNVYLRFTSDSNETQFDFFHVLQMNHKGLRVYACIIPLLMQYVVDHARAIDIIKVVIKTVDRLLGRKEGEDMDLITYVTDRKGHDMRYAIDSRKLQKELGWEPSLQFEEGIEETVKWYLDNQEWMDHVTSGEYQKYYEEMYC